MKRNVVFGLCYLTGVLGFGVYAAMEWDERIDMERKCIVAEWERAGDNPGAIIVGVKDYCKAKVAIERGLR